MFFRLPSAGHLHVKAVPQPETTVPVQLRWEVADQSLTVGLRVVALFTLFHYNHFQGLTEQRACPYHAADLRGPSREPIIISLRCMSESKA